jgi:DNA-directed RNA polymerase subunit RPC12/RpoP
MIHKCPNCNVSLQGKPFSEASIAAGYHSPICHECGKPNHLDLRIAIYDRITRKVIQWKCPHCNHTIPHLTLEGSYEYNYI